jgi:tRNA threonylcarbamoyladenosine biosynthesis protein TsaE
MAREVVSRSEQETRAVARSLELRVGDVVLIEGELGAGKTVFVKGIAEACGVQTMVRSPTFALMHRYRGEPDLIHIDLYREESGFDDLDLNGASEEAIIAVEWPKQLAQEVWPESISVRIEHVDEHTRRITLP